MLDTDTANAAYTRVCDIRFGLIWLIIKISGISLKVCKGIKVQVKLTLKYQLLF